MLLMYLCDLWIEYFDTRELRSLKFLIIKRFVKSGLAQRVSNYSIKDQNGKSQFFDTVGHRRNPAESHLNSGHWLGGIGCHFWTIRHSQINGLWGS